MQVQYTARPFMADDNAVAMDCGMTGVDDCAVPTPAAKESPITNNRNGGSCSWYSCCCCCCRCEGNRTILLLSAVIAAGEEEEEEPAAAAFDATTTPDTPFSGRGALMWFHRYSVIKLKQMR